ncbi:MAG TPA: TolC family protein [Thermoanaerobaculia bacterium]|nr:TolC family protein [Thermoanaerobaculia bacterium]
MKRVRSCRIVPLAFLGVAAQLFLAEAATGEAAEPRLRAAVERAIAGNPEISEMELRIEAAKQRVPQSLALPDARLVAGAINVPVPDVSFAREDMTMKMVSLEQMIPASGKRRAAAGIATAEVEMAEAMHVAHVNRLVADVADAYYEVAELDARLTIARRSLERLGRVSESVRTRYRVGQGGLPDVLLAGVEETKVRDRIRALEADRASAAARLNTLQGLAPAEPVAPIAFSAADQTIPDRAALSAALERSPDVLEKQAEVRRAERDLEGARLERRPDLTFMASYGERQRRDDMIGATVGINLPFFQRRRLAARIAEKEAELGAAKKRLESVRLRLSREVEDAGIAIGREFDRAALYRGTILTQDRTAAEAAEQAYAVGRIDFQTYVRAVLAVDDDEAETVMRETALPRARAKLLASAGVPLPEISGLEVRHD